MFWSLKQLCGVYIDIYIYGIFCTNGASNIEIQLKFFSVPCPFLFSEKGEKRIRHLIIPCCGTLWL